MRNSVHKLIVALLPALFLAGSDLRGEVTTHLERIEMGFRQAAEKVYARDGMPDTLCLNVVEHPADWLVYQAFTGEAQRQKRTAIRCTPPYFGEILIAITEVRVDLVEVDDDELFRRVITLGIALSLPRLNSRGEEERYTSDERVILSDTIQRGDAPDLAAESYQFTQPRYIASTSTSFWKKVAEPAVVLGTTVVMVILLFTTRSQ